MEKKCCITCANWIDATAECAVALKAEANGWDIPPSVENTLENDADKENHCTEYEEA